MHNKYILQEKNFILTKNDDEYNWLEIISPTEEELKSLLSKFNLPRDYVFDVSDPYELPRTEGLEMTDLIYSSFRIRSGNPATNISQGLLP